MPASGALPYGYRDARIALLVVAVVGEALQGGLVFGWNALAVMIKSQGNYLENCKVPTTGKIGCQSQESKLAVLWTLGIFALNFGPVFVGPILDLVGPKLASILGVVLNMLGLLLLAFSSTSGTNAFIPAAIILGLGGMTFHLAQFHISNLFPRKRGLVSSLLVAGFTGCGVIFYILYRIYEDLDATGGAYRGVLIGYTVVCALWIPLQLWMMPWHSLKIGQLLVLTRDWRLLVVQRSDLERPGSEIRLGTVTTLHGAKASPPPPQPQPEQPASDKLAGEGMPALTVRTGGKGGKEGRQGLINGVADSSDARWLANGNGRGASGELAEVRLDSPDVSPTRLSTPTRRAGRPRRASADVLDEVLSEGEAEPPRGGLQSPPSDSKGDHALSEPSSPDETAPAAARGDVVWGPLVFEARRFVELRKYSFRDQLKSAESLGMGLFYTANVFCIQFYLGTTRLQLTQKGDDNLTYTSIANIVPAFGFLGIPVISWLLDRKGFGITLFIINFLGVLASLLQAMPSLGLQIVTLIVWCTGRFFMYTSYFHIFGALFGHHNFGKMVAIDNTVNGAVGLAQLPLTNWGLHGLGGNFTAINLLQAAVLLPLFTFAYMMYRWERQDLVPIRPLEGEELPVNMLPQRRRTRSKGPF